MVSVTINMHNVLRSDISQIDAVPFVHDRH